MTAFAAAVGALFADPNIGRDAIYTPKGGAPMLVHVVARRADAITDFGDARLWSETTRIDLRVTEVASPRPGDRIEIDSEAFGFWLKATFGAPTTTGTSPGPYTHVFQTGNWTLPSMALEIGMRECRATPSIPASWSTSFPGPCSDPVC